MFYYVSGTFEEVGFYFSSKESISGFVNLTYIIWLKKQPIPANVKYFPLLLSFNIYLSINYKKL